MYSGITKAKRIAAMGKMQLIPATIAPNHRSENRMRDTNAQTMEKSSNFMVLMKKKSIQIKSNILNW